MKIYYITLNTDEEAKAISLDLLDRKLALCTNWFPISCAYLWEGEIKQGSEIVLIVKTKEDVRTALENVISDYISYTNCIAELDVHSVNQKFSQWMNTELS